MQNMRPAEGSDINTRPLSRKTYGAKTTAHGNITKAAERPIGRVAKDSFRSAESSPPRPPRQCENAWKPRRSPRGAKTTDNGEEREFETGLARKLIMP